jgi:predicted nucleotidyltransferase component of viral defense system
MQLEDQMNPSLEFLERCSAETGYQVSSLEKVVRLGEMAGDIARHPFLGEALALKGGSALNLCYGPPSRLSVDLDYNYIANLDRDAMLADRPRVEDALIDLAKRHSYRIQKSAEAFAGRKIFLRYRSAIGQEERIEIDLNFLFRLPISRPGKRAAWQPGGLDQPLINIVGLDELLIGKMLAFLDRCTARDAWDIVHLSEPATLMLKDSSFRARFIALAAILEKPLPTYTHSRLKTLITKQLVEDQLVPMLSSPFLIRPDELAEKAWSEAAPLISLHSHEAEYIDAIHRGDLFLNLLFPNDAAEVARLSGHPAILWKLENVRSHHLRKKQVH